MFFLFFILSVVLLITGAYYLLFKWNKNTIDYIENENADDYLMAEKVFARDPEAFKDKDRNGIDDIIDNTIK
jgi:hypothetical protein